MLASLQHLFVPSYLTVLYAFLGGAAYGFTGNNYGFVRITILCIICSVVYVMYSLGIIK
jgi:lipoprotein signal peptidase